MLKSLRRVFAQLSDSRQQIACAQVAKLIPLHVAGELTNKHAAIVARHLLACADCRATADEYAASRTWLQAGAQAQFEDKFYDEIRAHVLGQIRQTQRPAPPVAAPLFAPLFKWQLLYVAASIALLALVGALAWRGASNRSDLKQTALVNINAAIETANRTPKVIETPTPVSAPVHEPLPQRAPVFRRHVNQPQVVAANSPQSLTPRAVKQPEPQPEHSLTPQQGVAPGNGTQQAVTSSSGAEVARIELQTADPNIRIIWLAQQPTDAQPTKDK